MMLWDMRLRLITQCDRGVFPHVCVVQRTLSICCLFAFSLCLSAVTLCTLAPYTPFHAHLFTNNSTKTNKQKNKNKNNVVYGHTLFVLIASKRVTTRHHESGLRGLNELCVKRREAKRSPFCFA